MPDTPFKICNTCSRHWETIIDFIADPEIVLLGYQADFLKQKDGVFLFSHGTCANTLALNVHRFKHLVDGPIFTENKKGRDGCPEYCVHGEELAPCKDICECRWVHDVMQLLQR